MGDDPFDRFLVDENEPLDKNLVVEIISPFVESVGKNKIVRYTEEFEKLPSWLKISVYLCCRKVMTAKEIVATENVGPKEIAKETSISEASAKDISRHSKLQKIVSKDDSGCYFIPNYKLKLVKKLVDEYGRARIEE